MGRLTKVIYVDASESEVREDETGSILIQHNIRHAYDGCRSHSRNQHEVLCTKNLPVYLLKSGGDSLYSCGRSH